MTLEWEEIKEDLKKAHRGAENVFDDKLSTNDVKTSQKA